jgi:periodic tryptophan protein 1
LASGSVDQTVILWDLDKGEPATTIKDFNEKVQTLKFHPKEPQYLLTGCCDGLVKLFDCRSTTDESSSFVSWNMNAEIERVAWDHFDNNYFAASSNDGHVAYFDMRNQQAPVWSIKAHEKEVTGLVMSSKVKGMLSTASDGELIVWNYLEDEPKQLYKKLMRIGQIQCLVECPENPMVLSMGGDNKHKNFAVQDLREEEVDKLFPNYRCMGQDQDQDEAEDEEMDE